MKNQFCGQHTRRFVKPFASIFPKFQKKACGKVEANQKIILNSRHYKVDGKVGRFEFSTHSVVNGNTEKEGAGLINYMERKTKTILSQNNFTEDGCYQGDDQTYLQHIPAKLAQKMVTKAAENFSDNYAVADILNNPVYYEDPEQTVNISIDDVNVKKQEETRARKDNPEKRRRKYVYNTVVHIGNGQEIYTLNGYGMKTVLSYLIAFLINNGLPGNRFQFFTDGHTTLNKTIINSFRWYKNVGIILDWYHLEKKCKEQLSMALKGREIRNQVLIITALKRNNESKKWFQKRELSFKLAA